MPRSGEKTRRRIVDAAQDLTFENGFAATSIDKVIDRAGITKGAFFYHFRTKHDLGKELIERYAERDFAHLERTIERAEKLSDDPRQQALIFVGLLQEIYEALPDPIPGCLLTSYLYGRDGYPDEVAQLARQAFDRWRDRVADKLDEAAGGQRLAGQTTPNSLATTLLALIEGGYVLAKAHGDGGILVDLLGQFRAQLERALPPSPPEDLQEPAVGPS